MSHNPERKEKDCLNCGAVIQGRFCHICGQENIIPRESFWGIITHFFQDITHFDGKFFSTIRYLVLRPGYLTAEFFRGRRVSYVHPIRLYVFTSAFFFLLFFSFFLELPNQNRSSKNPVADELKKRELDFASLDSLRVNTKDSGLKLAITRCQMKLRLGLDSLKIRAEQEAGQLRIAGETRRREREKVLEERKKRAGGLNFSTSKESPQEAIKISDYDDTDDDLIYPSVEVYKMVQAELPDSMRDKGMKRYVMDRMIHLGEKQKKGGSEFSSVFMEKFIHYFPQMMFVSLPMFALVLQLLYIRRRFFYGEHAIFTIHYYCASFLFLLIIYLFQYLGKVSGWELFNWLMTITLLFQFIYLYKAMRYFYRQGRIKTILKFLLINFAFVFMSGLLVLGYLIWTVNKI